MVRVVSGALRQASKRAVTPVQLRDNKPIKDVRYNNKPERQDLIGWAENILSASASDADLSTLRIEWLNIPDISDPGVTDRSSHERHNRIVNGWMTTCDCLALAATLPYIGLFTMVGSAKLHKAAYIFFTNSKTYHRGSYPGSVFMDLEGSSNNIGFSQAHYHILPKRLADKERLQSAVQGLVRNLRAKVSDDRKAARPFSRQQPTQGLYFPILLLY